MAISGFIFLIAFFGGLALAFIRHPTYGLYTYVAVFYLHPPSRWWGEFLPDLRWSLLAAVVTLVAALRLPHDASRPAWYSTRPAKLIIAFTAWIWLQNLWAMDKEMHLELSILYTKYILLFYLVYRLIQTPDQLRVFLLVHIAGCGYLGWLGYNVEVSGRLEGLGGPGIDEANALAMQLGTAVMIGAMMILAERKWRLWFCIAAMPFILNTIVLAGSRGAFLALLAGGFVLWYLRPAAHRKLFYGFAALGVVLMGMLAHEAFWERMGTMKAAVNEEEEMDTSAESRIHLIKSQWRMFLDHPLGGGHRATEVLSPDYLDQKYMSGPADQAEVRRRSSHNTFMSALVEQGLPGALLFGMMWLWCLRTVRSLRPADGAWSPQTAAMAAGVSGACAVLFVAGMFVDYLKAEVQTWLFALLAVLSCMAAQALEAKRQVVAQAQSPARPTPLRPARPAVEMRKLGR
jgi:O-antigen ligase